MDGLMQSIFKNSRADEAALAEYGFTKSNGGFAIRKELGASGFTINITVTPPSAVSAEVYDDEGEPYTLHLVDGAAGSFVGVIRTEYEKILRDVKENCFRPDVFQAKQSEQVTKYARERYGDELEFLWADLPDCAVLRRKDTRKWYAAIMTITKNKLGLDGTEKVEILDVRADPGVLPSLVDGERYFAGYHMNKKHWLTVVLDGSVPTREICSLLDGSYLLAIK